MLRIGYNYKGLTEIGGLVVRPEFRRHPERLGRLLMSVRFLYIARHRDAFRDEVLSELMPPLEPDGTSLLWESLGRQFTGLSYQEADRLSQDNKEFIRALFPQDPLYASLLPAHVQERIGEVGPGHEGGGEGAARDRVQLRAPHRSVRRRSPFPGAHRRHHAGACDAHGARGRAPTSGPARRPFRPSSRGSGRRRRYFTAVRTAIAGAAPPAKSGHVAAVTLELAAEARDALQVAPGDEIAYLRLP